MEKYEDAIKCYDRALSVSFNNASLWNTRGQALLAWGLHISKDTNIFQNAKIEQIREMKDEALKCFDTAVDIDSKYVDAILNKASLFDSPSKVPDAMKCFDTAITIDANNTEAYLRKAKFLDSLRFQSSNIPEPLEDKTVQEIIDCYDAVLRIDPEYIYALVQKALYLTGLKKYEDALKCCDEVLKLDHLNANAVGLKMSLVPKIWWKRMFG
jgi:tetratricopeptide (TPR) repeat protein